MAPDKMERVNVQLQTIENVSKIKPYGLERMIIPYAARIETSKLEGLEMLAKKQTKERKTINLSNNYSFNYTICISKDAQL